MNNLGVYRLFTNLDTDSLKELHKKAVKNHGASEFDCQLTNIRPCAKWEKAKTQYTLWVNNHIGYKVYQSLAA